jgi:antibiotic biosynthesis monooxygenase (ABM) superfamily enzyme
MNRRMHLRSLLGSMLGSALAAVALGPLVRAQAGKKPIQLFVEMEIEPSHEKELLDNFHNIFLPEAKKHPGYISVKLLKLRSVVQGPASAFNYRFELVFESEELRQKWIASPEHQKVWPTVEKTLKSRQNYPVSLFDEV